MDYKGIAWDSNMFNTKRSEGNNHMKEIWS